MLVVLLGLFAVIVFGRAEEAGPARVVLGLSLKDGSRIMATPVSNSVRVHQRLAGSIALDWAKIHHVTLEKGSAEVMVLFANQDRLTAGIEEKFLEVESALGRLQVPVETLVRIEVTRAGGPSNNVALGKPVYGEAGASHGEGLAKHVTDGDPATHAKPPASNFIYRIDLQDGADVGYRIKEIRINWGCFGDQFKGVRAEDGEKWASGAWPGEYVTSYEVEYRQAGQQNWVGFHQFKGRPVDEKAGGVEVRKRPTTIPGCSSESETRIWGLDLKNVAEFRIRAKGGHWIGLYEFEAHGHRE